MTRGRAGTQQPAEENHAALVARDISLAFQARQEGQHGGIGPPPSQTAQAIIDRSHGGRTMLPEHFQDVEFGLADRGSASFGHNSFPASSPSTPCSWTL